MTTESPHPPFASQQDLVADVLAAVPSVPERPLQGQYLSLEEADRIVAETIHHSLRTDSAQEYEYLKGHRYRLAVSLSMIPKAEIPEASCLDIGCYGYMAFWAWRYLGYARVEGIEMRPGEPAEILRTIEIDGAKLDLPVHNFCLEQEHWPIHSCFDTLLFFETLEHVSHDPSGVMFNVSRLMKSTSTLVMSVPNCVSYKTLQEFLMGAPPWTYWFFRPDLGHEPRHSFEYTPIFFKIFLRAAGFHELCFRTFNAYARQDDVQVFYDLGASLAIGPKFFGDTIIVQACRVTEEPLFRHPDCIYDADRYYETTYPILRPQLDQALASLKTTMERNREVESRALERITKAEQRAGEAELAVRAAEQRAIEAELAIRAAEQRASDAESAVRAAEHRCDEADIAAKEAFFLCDVYRSKLDASEERAHAATVRFKEMVASTTWRFTRPVRKLLDQLKRLRSRIR